MPCVLGEEESCAGQKGNTGEVQTYKELLLGVEHEEGSGLPQTTTPQIKTVIQRPGTCLCVFLSIDNYCTVVRLVVLQCFIAFCVEGVCFGFL